MSILFAYINTNDIDKPISNFSEIRSDGSFSTEDTSQEGQIRELIYEFDFDNRVFSIRRDGINLFSGYIAPDANKFLEKFRFDLQYRVGVEYYTHYIKIEKKIKAIELAFWKNLRNCTET